MSGSKLTQDQFDEAFQALEREEKRLWLYEQAIAMRPQRMRTLEAMTDTVKPSGMQKGQTTF